MGYFDDLYEDEKKKKKPSQVAAKKEKAKEGGYFGDLFVESPQATKSAVTKTVSKPKPTVTPKPTSQPQAPQKQGGFTGAVSQIGEAIKIGVQSAMEALRGNEIQSPIPKESIVSTGPKNIPLTSKPTQNRNKVTSKLDLSTPMAGQSAGLTPLVVTGPNIVDTLRKQIGEGMTTLATKGVVSNMGQVAPRSEWGRPGDKPGDAEKRYQKALADSKEHGIAESINKGLGLGVVGLVTGATGGFFKPKEVKTDTIEDKVVYGVSNILGSVASIKKIAGVFDSLFKGSTTVGSIIDKYPKAAKYIIPYATNVLAFDVYGQLDPDTENRFKKLAEDTALGTLFTAVGHTPGKISIPANFGVGFGLAKLSGASDEDAFISGGILSALDASGKAKTALLRSEFRQGELTMSPEQLRTQANSTNFKGTPAEAVLRRAAAAAEAAGKDVKINLEVARKSKTAKLFNAETPEGFKFSVELVDKKQIQLLKEEGAPQQAARPTTAKKPVKSEAVSENVPAVVREEIVKRQTEIKAPTEFRTPTEEKAYKQLEKETPAAFIDKYIDKNANELNPDIVRTMFSDYKGHNVVDFNRPVGQLKDKIYDRMLTDNKGQGDNTVLITAGGSGSGKTLSVAEALPRDKSDYSVILDSTFSYQSAGKDVEKALDNGFDVDIAFVLREPIEAWRNGVIPRVKTEGRIVSEGYFLKTHKTAREKVLEQYETYKDNPNVRFHIIDNREGRKQLIGIEALKNFSYNNKEVVNSVIEATEKAYEEGKLTKEQYEATIQDRPEQGRKDVTGRPQEGLSQNEKVTPPPAPKISQIEKEYREAEDAVIEAINSGDLESAAALRDAFVEEGISLPPTRDIIDGVTTANQELLNEAISEIEAARISKGPDDPTNRLLDIAAKIRSNILLLAKGNEKEIKNEAGSFMLGGKANRVYDRLIDQTDIVGFSRNIHVLHLSVDKVFTEIHNDIKRGDIDGADYEAFKKQITEYRQQIKTARPARRRPASQNVSKQKDSTAAKTGSKTSGFASVGDFSNLNNRTYAEGKLKSLELPELVSMARELSGKIPDLKAFRGDKKGEFVIRLSKDGKDVKIQLNPSIFKDPSQAAKTLAHEIGHLVDYLPSGTITRGNLLGRIASLNKYMKTLLKEFPGAEGELITTKERAQMRARAKSIANKTPVIVKEEIVTGTEPVDPKDILVIWQSMTGGMDNKELLSYISSLSTERKVEIVKAAMRNRIPEWVTYVKEVKKTITREVLQNSPADIRKLYKKMLREEIIARRLVDLETVKKELQMVSQKWKPYNPNLEPPAYVEYRNRAAELYADAISVLLIDPVMLKEEAPTFWKAFYDYLDAKPDVKDTLFGTWDLLHKGEEAVFQKRQKDVEQMFDNAEQQFTAKELERQKVKTNIGYTLKLLFNNKNEPLMRKVTEARKSGKLIDSATNPVFAYEGLNYMDGKLENFIEENFQPVYKKAQEISSEGWQKLGSVLLYERAMNERGEMANPLGFNPKTAQEQLTGLEKSMSKEDWNSLQESVKAFREATQRIVSMAEKAEFYSPELIAQMKANPAYAAFQVIDYLDTYVSAHVYKSIGTLKEIANPATSSVMKGISVLKAIERNNAKKLAVDFFKKEFPDEIEPAKFTFDGKRRRFVEPDDKEKGLITLIEGGKATAYYVDKDLATMMNGLSSDTINKAAKISRLLTGSSIYRPLFTTFNLGFQTFNFVRDFQRYWSNVPDYTLGQAMTSLPRAVFRYGQAVPSALRKELRMPDKTIREMKELGILGATYNDMFQSHDVDPEDQQIERIMRRVGILEKTNKRKIFTPIFKVLDTIEAMGNFIESLPKIAGYNELKGKMSPEEMADFIRTKVGSPNFRAKGTLTPVTNNVFLFSNAIKEGIKSDYQVASGKAGRKSAAGFWWKTILSTFLPVLIAFAGTMGLFGKWYKDRLADVSEYDKTNYTIIPTGTDENGKTVYLRIPRAETQRFLGGLLWKTLRNATREDLRLEDIFDVFDYGAGQVPNVTPAITGSGALISYLSGHNPYDSFRNRYVIPDTEFKAGFEYSLPIFVDWFTKNQGAGVMLPSFVDKDPSQIQKALALPFISNIAGRWLKVSNYGQTEKNRRIIEAEEREAAQKTLKTREALDKAIQDYKKYGTPSYSRKKAYEQQLVKDVIGTPKTAAEKTARTNLIKRFELGIMYGEAGALTDSLIRANTNEQKAELIFSAKKDLGSKYQSFIKDLKRKKIISDDVIEKLKNKK